MEVVHKATYESMLTVVPALSSATELPVGLPEPDDPPIANAATAELQEFASEDAFANAAGGGILHKVASAIQNVSIIVGRNLWI